ncbi:hypothetical protein J14TS5_46650 [Paenibacillus lautus]|nr:hypothetical protein J14TS5_46650 [Paenibacillus lautus]
MGVVLKKFINIRYGCYSHDPNIANCDFIHKFIDDRAGDPDQLWPHRENE